MITFVFSKGASLEASTITHEDDARPAISIVSGSQPFIRNRDQELTCLSLVRRKKEKNVSMKLLLRHYASE